MTQLSLHFSLDELTRSDTAARLGIENTPTPAQVEALTWLASQIERVRRLTGPLRVNSGYRSPGLNAVVGSKPTSQHVKCEAADLSSMAGLTALEMCRLVEASGIPFDQVIWEFGSWMHISFVRGRRPRADVLTIDRHGAFSGLPKLPKEQ